MAFKYKFAVAVAAIEVVAVVLLATLSTYSENASIKALESTMQDATDEHDRYYPSL